MSATIADLNFHRAIRELKAATIACEAATRRTREQIKIMQAETAKKRQRIEADMRRMDVALPADCEFQDGAA